MDYRKHIDAETWAFIAATSRFYPADTVSRPLAEQRQFYGQMCEAFHAGYPPGVAARDEMAGSVPIRSYEKGTPIATVVYFHGGGFVLGGLESHDDICAEICDRTGNRVVSVDYRLAPEFKHPAAFDDALAATGYVLEHFQTPVILCGDSAGGGLAASVAHAMRGQTEKIIGQVLIYPTLGGDQTLGSYLTHADAPMLSRDELDFYAVSRSGGEVPQGDPTFAALQDHDFADLPTTAIITAECDPLADDGRDYRDAILDAGGQAIWSNEPGMIHGFLRARTTVARAAKTFDRIIEALRALEECRWPPFRPP